MLLLLFVASGACGLTYQVLWLRSLSLVFGVTVHAASTVLAAFMGGLALGSYLAAPLRRRISRPLAAFGLAEIGIGLSALATPFGLTAAESMYAALHAAAPESLPLLTGARLLGSMIVLLVPTVLMGLTLPLVSASAIVRGARFGSRISLLYAANTAGAMIGVVTTGFILIGSLGMHRTFLTAGAINVTVGLLAVGLSRRIDEVVPALEDDSAGTRRAEPSTSRTTLPAALALVVFLSGLASLALEIVWFRILLQFVPGTSYAFTAMLASVLAGIAAGGAVASRLLRRDRHHTLWLAQASVATGVAVPGALMFLAWTYQAGWGTSGTLQACAAAILPASIGMGLAFPFALRLATEGREDRTAAARAIGRVYAVNVIGAIAGALLGGFLILPILGSRRSVLVLSALYAIAGLLLLVARPTTRQHVPKLGPALAMFAATAFLVPDPFVAALTRRHGEGYRELFRADGLQTAATVHADDRKRVLFLDGVHQADDTPAIVRTHWQIGHLPMVLHPHPNDALVVGLGGGASPGAISQHHGVRVHVIELSDSVRRAAAYFGHVNYEILEQPSLRLRMDDGRNFLKLTDQRFDVITADVVHPTYAGAGTLYSREYFQLVRNALDKDGLVLQWIGHRPEAHYKIIMRTFLDVFPDATLWVDGTLMVGSIGPLRADAARVLEARADPRTRAALDAIGLTSPDVLRSWFRAGPEEMRAFVGPGPLLTDDRPRLEYHWSLPRTAMVDLSSMPQGDPVAVFGQVR